MKRFLALVLLLCGVGVLIAPPAEADITFVPPSISTDGMDEALVTALKAASGQAIPITAATTESAAVGVFKFTTNATATTAADELVVTEDTAKKTLTFSAKTNAETTVLTLTTLDLSAADNKTSIKNVSGLAECTGLKVLTLTGLTALQEIDLDGLTGLTTVTTANTGTDDNASMTKMSITNSGSSAGTGVNLVLTGCTALETLDLTGSTLVGQAGAIAATGYGLQDLDKATKLQSLVLNGVALKNGAGTLQIPEELTKLVSIDISGAALSALTLEDAEKNEKLESVIACNVDKGTAVALTLSKAPALKTVIASNDTGLTVNVSVCPKLETLDLTGSKLAADTPTVTNCAALSTLILDKTTPATLGTLDISSVSALETLSMAGSTAFQALTLGKDNTSLTAVDASDCTALVTITTGTTKLEKLETLNLSGCTELTGIAASAPANAINLSALTALKTLDLKCASGKANAGVHEVNLTAATGLISADLSYCTGLTEVNATDLASLKELNLTGCTMPIANVTTNTIAEVSLLDLSGCTSLASLDVTSCTALTNITAKASGLKEITGLDKCTKLKTLDARNSGLLALDLSKAPLTTLNVVGNALAKLDLSNTSLTSTTATVNDQKRTVTIPASASAASLAADSFTFDFADLGFIAAVSSDLNVYTITGTATTAGEYKIRVIATSKDVSSADIVITVTEAKTDEEKAADALKPATEPNNAQETAIKSALNSTYDVEFLTPEDIVTASMNFADLDSELKKAVSDDTMSFVCALPKIKPTKTAIYVMRATFSSPKAGTPRLFDGEDTTAAVTLATVDTSTANAKFYDSSYTPKNTLATGDTSIVTAVVLEKDKTYTPVLASETSGGTGGSSSSGCDAGFGALAVAILGLLGLKRK